MGTTKANINLQKPFFDPQLDEMMIKTQNNWLDKKVVNRMINNFNYKEKLLKRNQLVKTAQPMKLRESYVAKKKKE